jgi:hypothetical protein
LKVLAWRNKCITRVEVVEHIDQEDIDMDPIVIVLSVTKKDIEKAEDKVLLKADMYMIKNQEIMKRMLRWSYRLVKNPAVESVRAQNVVDINEALN